MQGAGVKHVEVEQRHRGAKRRQLAIEPRVELRGELRGARRRGSALRAHQRCLTNVDAIHQQNVLRAVGVQSANHVHRVQHGAAEDRGRGLRVGERLRERIVDVVPHGGHVQHEQDLGPRAGRGLGEILLNLLRHAWHALRGTRDGSRARR